ncbi:MAG: hypothetical protein RLY71_4479 [Pseudomonadota bacterium]|jgi:2Fe-2S ferredoxin
MPQITYIEDNGQATTVNVPEGWNLMQAATANGVDGIIGECGGSCACATCHCYVDELLAAMLDNVAAERRPTSRLACQLKASAAMDGASLRLPAHQE